MANCCPICRVPLIGRATWRWAATTLQQPFPATQPCPTNGGSPWCMDRRSDGGKCFRISRSCDADVLGPSKIKHAIEDGGGDCHLGHLASVGARVKGATYHLLPAIDVRFDERTKIVARDLLP